LKALAGNDEVKIAIVKSEGLQLILASMTQHQGLLFYFVLNPHQDYVSLQLDRKYKEKKNF
jgi:hypothetical protein